MLRFCSFEAKYKTANRLGEELDVLLAWIRETKEKLDHPPKVLVQLKEIARLKSQHQVIDYAYAFGSLFL